MLLGTLEQLLNRGLPRSIRARQLCAELSGRTLAIEARDLARLLLRSNGVTLELRHGTGPADATLAGGAVSLVRLMGERARDPLQQGEVTLAGDTEVAQQFQELLKLLRPDAEEELSLLLGDVPAHQLGRLARGGLSFLERLGRTATQNAAEYLAHERRELVPRAEGEQFLRGVDAVREGVDRAAARLEILARRRQSP
ncbi:MAG TPA: SCP2 sterol-binding domain-containing protein [Steroidobacteraceae bacterium]|nr:SCP2 sterol-binding domain-containing protein [Steroidobacteraceae bacterium]